ncbi:uncharacterized protein LOC121763444 isoform X1 [Salvia splendens]|uniref:uncharacterized protein LOC121763444 isoform X1 n=1 Tax=Salvia splendens TaxID=180675 RepID=UPI001C27DC17|nr:uncharacterized protein LOC121763444 isoform X1 [Salvia splendens]XP_042015398.1 uncharacterized protein LOC121763444 isoform X1 [Salvia splendens]
MTLAQFSMVEELASLVKDNYPCKHLILSVEDLLVNYLQDDTSLDGVLELEPMNSYNRLLVHRLAEIFGFFHHSVGEGEDRHLVLERSPETSIPGILVSDLLLQYGEMQTPMCYDVLRRKEVLPGQKVDPVCGPSLDERETAYFAARQRIFSEDACDSNLIKERPKKDLVVDRRMITRALGQAEHELTKESEELVVEDVKIKHTDKSNIMSSNNIKTNPLSGKHPRACTISKINKSSELKVMDGSSKEPQQKNNSKDGESLEELKSNSPDNHLRQEHMGAARRLFANALRMQRRDVNLSNKETGC